MKWLIIFYSFIIFSIGVLGAETDEKDNDEIDDCAEKIQNNVEREFACLNSINRSQIFNEIEMTLLGYSGDDDSIHALANRNCPIIHQIIQCVAISEDVGPNCIPPISRLLNTLEREIPNSVLSYFCANNAAALLRLLESGGLETVYKNEKFNECVKLMRNDSENERTLESTITGICVGLEKVFECYTDLVNDHNNKNLVGIATDVRTVIRETAKCPS